MTIRAHTCNARIPTRAKSILRKAPVSVSLDAVTLDDPMTWDIIDVEQLPSYGATCLATTRSLSIIAKYADAITRL